MPNCASRFREISRKTTSCCSLNRSTFFTSAHQQQLAAQEFHVAAKLGLREPLTGNRQEHAVDISEIVHHERLAAYRGRQSGLDVVDLAAKLVPDLGDGGLLESILDDGRDYRSSASGLRLDALELAQLLAGAFDRVGDFPGDLLRAGSWIRRDDQRFLDRELRVFQASQPVIRDESAQRRRETSRRRLPGSSEPRVRRGSSLVASECVAQIANLHPFAQEWRSCHHDAVARPQPVRRFRPGRLSQRPSSPCAG